VAGPRDIFDAQMALIQGDDREAQLALRAVVGTRDLDTFLTEKDAVTSAFEDAVRRRYRKGKLTKREAAYQAVGRDPVFPQRSSDAIRAITRQLLVSPGLPAPIGGADQKEKGAVFTLKPRYGLYCVKS